jgi:hypothetical protein
MDNRLKNEKVEFAINTSCRACNIGLERKVHLLGKQPLTKFQKNLKIIPPTYTKIKVLFFIKKYYSKINRF